MITINPQETGRDSTENCSAMLNVAQSARENVTPQSGVTRKWASPIKNDAKPYPGTSIWSWAMPNLHNAVEDRWRLLSFAGNHNKKSPVHRTIDR